MSIEVTYCNYTFLLIQSLYNAFIKKKAYHALISYNYLAHAFHVDTLCTCFKEVQIFSVRTFYFEQIVFLKLTVLAFACSMNKVSVFRQNAAASDRLQNVIKYCTKVPKTGLAGQKVE